MAIDALAMLFIHQGRNLLGHQADQENDDRGAEQQGTHIGQAAFGEEGEGVIAKAG